MTENWLESKSVRESDDLSFGKGRGGDDFNVRYRAISDLHASSLAARISKARHRALSAPRRGVFSEPGFGGNPTGPKKDPDATLVAPKKGLVLRLATGSPFVRTKRKLRQIHAAMQNKQRTMSPELTNSVQSAASWVENPEWLWLLRFFGLMVLVIVVILGLMAVPLGDPYSGLNNNLVFVVYYTFYVTGIGTTCNVVYAFEVLQCPLPFWKVASSGILAGCVATAMQFLFGLFNTFPLPYFPVVGGCFAVPTALFSALAMQPKSVFKDPIIKKRLSWVLLMMLVNVGSGFLYALYVALFSSVPGSYQVIVAPLLPFCKVCVKYLCGYFARKVENPDFRHGTALFPDLCATCVSSIIFINVNSIDSFLVLLTIDTAINLKHCLVILSEVTKSEREKHERIVRTLCASPGGTADVAIAFRDLKATTLNPHIVEICGDFFFSEVTESLVPLVNGMAAWIAYYLPVCNRRWFTYMWQNTEEEFTQGMRYILLDCFVQLLLFFLLARYVYFKTKVPVMHVGLALANRHKLLFTWLICGLVSFYVLIFMDHSGVDTTLRFAWLKPGFNSSRIVRHMMPCEL